VITRHRHTLAESRPTLECSSGVYVTVINSEFLFLGEYNNGFPMAFLSIFSSLITAKMEGSSGVYWTELGEVSRVIIYKMEGSSGDPTWADVESHHLQDHSAKSSGKST